MIRAGIRLISEFFTNWITLNTTMSRKGFWLTQLSIVVALSVMLFVVGFVEGMTKMHGLANMVTGVLVLVLFIPSIAMTCRRLNDAGYPRWVMLITFIPFGSLVLMGFLVLPKNHYFTCFERR
jgi:uncharacterized membrane protein YhaH (DUF805 family)